MIYYLQSKLTYISKGDFPHFRMSMYDVISPFINFKVRGKDGFKPKFKPEFNLDNNKDILFD